MPFKPGDTGCPLAEAVNTSTRQLHTKLNKAVIYRLSLAIPPQAADPSSYASGLLHIAPIYDTFETLWRQVLDESPQENVRVTTVLRKVHTAELERATALREDMQTLSGWSPAVLEEQLRAARRYPVLAAFLAHMEASVTAQPHVLLAYAWVFYMALFSGGRFIRGTLAHVPASAWETKPQKGRLPLAFFTFATPEDGDEIKMSFKQRFAEASHGLEPQEGSEVVEEARRIFEFMIDIVAELDGICNKEPAGDKVGESLMGRVGRMLGLGSGV